MGLVSFLFGAYSHSPMKNPCIDCGKSPKAHKQARCVACQRKHRNTLRLAKTPVVRRDTRKASDLLPKESPIRIKVTPAKEFEEWPTTSGGTLYIGTKTPYVGDEDLSEQFRMLTSKRPVHHTLTFGYGKKTRLQIFEDEIKTFHGNSVNEVIRAALV